MQDVIELVKAIATDRALEEAGGLQDFRSSGRGNKAVSLGSDGCRSSCAGT